MEPEVRYHMLRPAQIVERRKACPAVYIPIGTIEWHGIHNPTGADTLQAEHLAIRCAQKGGGLVFPPLYYGENRIQALMESNPQSRDGIAELMELPPENFAPEKAPFNEMDQSLNYHKLLIHILAEAEALGFKVGVLVAGHYPLVDHATMAALQFNKRMASRRDGMLAWAFGDFRLLADSYENPGDHGGGWETSHLMASHPESVDISILPPEPEKVVGAGGSRPPQSATAEFGHEIYEAAADVAVVEVARRLSNPSAYRGHGKSMLMGKDIG
jgi:creatinine amidohydrolase